MNETADAPYRQVYDSVRVARELFDRLKKHPAFRLEPQAINTAQEWLREIDAAINLNGGKPVALAHKRIQDRFRKHTQPHTTFRDALRDVGLITFTGYRPSQKSGVQGQHRTFALTALGRRLVRKANYQWLCALFNDPKARRKNQIAVAVAKHRHRSSGYTDPALQAIDAFRRRITFEHTDLLTALKLDKSVLAELKWDMTARPAMAGAALPFLLGIVRRDFGPLELREGKIDYEFASLPAKYRPFAVFNGRPYAASLAFYGGHVSFLGKMLNDAYQRRMDGPSSLPGDQTGAEVDKVKQDVKPRALQAERQQWTTFFTALPQPPQILFGRMVREADDLPQRIADATNVKVPHKSLTDYLNAWLNGETLSPHGEVQPFEKWFSKRFPEMAKVWASLGDRAKTGSLIAERYELPIMLNADLHACADGLGLTLAYEIDRIGVFAERDDGELSSKLERVKSFVRQQANGLFGVPVIATQI